MLQIDVPITPEYWDEEKEEFVLPTYKTLQMEHSLVSLSKWESKWHKSFLSNKTKSDEELLDYIKCMTITQNVNPEVYNHLSAENYEQINAYINDPMTATTFHNEPAGKKNNTVVTAELIHYWMIALNIPPQYEKWHLSRLITMIRVCEVKNSPPKNRSKAEMARYYSQLNAQRRQQHHTNG